MAVYYATIPQQVSTEEVFVSANSEVLSGMDGIVVAAHGDERMGDFFTLSKDQVFRACIEPRDILARVCDGAALGFLTIRLEDRSVHISRTFPTREVDDCSIPQFDHYPVMIALVAHQGFSDDKSIHAEYERCLDLLEPIAGGNRFTLSYEEIKKVLMHFQLAPKNLPKLLRKLGVGEDGVVKAHGEIQELHQFGPADFDLAGVALRFGFRGLYSVYPEHATYSVTNYPLVDYSRFCDLVDMGFPNILASIGRRYCSFHCKDGRITRTLEGNRFDIYRTKTKRTVTVSFDQHADEDPPVRLFSGGVRSKLASIGIEL